MRGTNGSHTYRKHWFCVCINTSVYMWNTHRWQKQQWAVQHRRCVTLSCRWWTQSLTIFCGTRVLRPRPGILMNLPVCVTDTSRANFESIFMKLFKEFFRWFWKNLLEILKKILSCKKYDKNLIIFNFDEIVKNSSKDFEKIYGNLKKKLIVRNIFKNVEQFCINFDIIVRNSLENFEKICLKFWKKKN